MLFLDELKKNHDQITNIFEIGAHRGYDIDDIVKRWPEANIYAFEADPFNYNICKQRCEQYKNVSVFNIAVTDENGTITFNRFCDIEKIPDSATFEGSNMQFTGCGSIKKPGDGLKNIYNIKEVTQEIVVDAITLEHFCTLHNISSIDAMFMNVQGAEMNVLNGCKDLINTTKAITLEWSTNRVLYDGETDFTVIKSFLESVGFKEESREYQIHGLNGDSLFVRLES
jgi:FkbM family methyltransferase